MKMHSYCAHNGMLSSIYFNMKDEENRLAALLKSFSDGGESIRKEAERKAQDHIRREKEVERETNRVSSNVSASTSRESSPAGSTSGASLSLSKSPCERYPVVNDDVPVGTFGVPTGMSLLDMRRLPCEPVTQPAREVKAQIRTRFSRPTTLIPRRVRCLLVHPSNQHKQYHPSHDWSTRPASYRCFSQALLRAHPWRK
jgi:hypothetical protein